MFRETCKGDSRELQRYPKGGPRVFQGILKAVSKTFYGSFKGVRKCQVCFKQISNNVLQFCWCMDLISVTRAEGGFVYPQTS